MLFGWLTYLVTASQPKFELSVLPATIRLHLLVLALGLAYVAFLAIKRRLPGPTRLDWPIAALALVYVAAVLDSIYPRVSLEYALLAIVPVLTFYAFHDFEFLTVDWFIRGLVAAGAVAAVAALYVAGSDYVGWLRLVNVVDGSIGLSDLIPPAVPRVHGVGGNVNILAMALNLLLPFALLMTLRARGQERAVATLASLLILLALFFTLSRGAWLGAIASLSLFAGLFLLRQRNPVDLLSRLVSSPKRVAVVVAPMLLILVLGSVLLAARWDSRPDWLFRASLGPRYDAMNVGIDVFRDRPWLGAGPGTYPLVYSAYSGDYPVENIHPHNSYINVLVDVGLAGAIVLVAGSVVLVLTIGRAYVRGDPEQRLALAACIAALTSIAIHSLLDSANAWNTALLPLAVVVALTLRFCAPLERRRTSGVASRWVPVVVISCLLAALLYAWPGLDARQSAYDKGIADLRNGRFAEGSVHAGEAADKDRSLAATQIQAGVSKAILYLVQSEKGRQPELSLLEDAKGYFNRAIEHDSRSAVAYANLALALRMQSEATKNVAFKHDAVEAARRVLVLAPSDGTAATVAGTVLEWADLGEDAIYAYSIAVLRDPSLAQSPFWVERPGRIGLREPALDDFDLPACEWARASAIYAGFPDDLNKLANECRDEVSHKPNDARARASLAIVLQALGRSDEARHEAEDAVRRVPDNPFALTALGIVKGASGDIAGARHELARASTLRDPYDPDAALLLAYTYVGPPAGNTVPRNLSLPVDHASLPGPVLTRLRTAFEHAAPMVFENGRQRYALGILYYRVRFLRESPTSILIPGEWLEMSSPRALLIEEALDGSKK